MPGEKAWPKPADLSTFGVIEPEQLSQGPFETQALYLYLPE